MTSGGAFNLADKFPCREMRNIPLFLKAGSNPAYFNNRIRLMGDCSIYIKARVFKIKNTVPSPLVAMLHIVDPFFF